LGISEKPNLSDLFIILKWWPKNKKTNSKKNLCFGFQLGANFWYCIISGKLTWMLLIFGKSPLFYHLAYGSSNSTPQNECHNIKSQRTKQS
jgi:hypothetical protein